MGVFGAKTENYFVGNGWGGEGEGFWGKRRIGLAYAFGILRSFKKLPIK
jgi:hypothetical protein